jgi:hypothetical protein
LLDEQATRTVSGRVTVAAVATGAIAAASAATPSTVAGKRPAVARFCHSREIIIALISFSALQLVDWDKLKSSALIGHLVGAQGRRAGQPGRGQLRHLVQVIRHGLKKIQYQPGLIEAVSPGPG